MAARLQEDPKRAGVTSLAWIMSASLAATGTLHPVLAARAATQAPGIVRVRELATRNAVLPMLAENPVGADHLRTLVGGALERA